jgi:murein DD-endopeptidase MepM/ murein hydrolase activator NlpD
VPAIFRTLLMTATLTAAACLSPVTPGTAGSGGRPASAAAGSGGRPTPAAAGSGGRPAPAAAGSSGRPAPAAAGIAAPVSEFGWPLLPVPVVSRPFQPPSMPYGPGHRGADLVGAPGQTVVAAGAGVVVYAGLLADRGVVSVDHTGGLRTTYEPLAVTVRAGQVVVRGDALGTLAAGHLGCAAPACLHWGLRRGREYLDPLLLVRPAHVRLLPWRTEP